MAEADNQVIEPALLFYPDATESEPLEKPTETEVEVETPEQDELTETEVDETETEELAEGEQEETQDEEETLYLDLDGEEHSLDEVKEWKAGSMRQADYTKKTQELSDGRNQLDADREAFNGEKSKVADLSAQLEVLVAEDSEIDWAELKEYEPEKYIELKEKADKRKAKLAEVKSIQPQANKLSDADIKTESNSLFAANPDWLEGGKDGKPLKTTDKYQADMKMVSEYASEVGYTQQDLLAIQRSSHWITLLDAAKFRAQKSKGSALKKKVKKAPLSTKPKAQQSKAKKSAANVFYGEK